MSNRFERSIQAAVLAGALTLAGCTGAGSDGGSGAGTSTGSGGEDGGTDGGSTGDSGEDGGDEEDTTPPLFLGGTVLEADAPPALTKAIADPMQVELRFSEAVEWDGDPSQFVLLRNQVTSVTFRLVTVWYQDSESYLGSTVSEVTSFRGYPGESDSLVLTATDVEAGDTSDTLIATFPTRLDADNTDGTNLLRLSYTTGDGGVRDAEGIALPGFNLEAPDGRWVPGNVLVPDEEPVSALTGKVRVVAPLGQDTTKPRLAFGRVIDDTHVALIFTEPIVGEGDLAAAFTLTGNQFEALQLYGYANATLSETSNYLNVTSTLSSWASGGYFNAGDSYPIASVYPLTDDPSNAVLMLKLSDALGEDASDGTGRLRLDYTTEGEHRIHDRAFEENTLNAIEEIDSSELPGNVMDQRGPPTLVRGLVPLASSADASELLLRFTAPVSWGGANPDALFTLKEVDRGSPQSVAEISTSYWSISWDWLDGDAISFTGDYSLLDESYGVRRTVLWLGTDEIPAFATAGSNRLRLSYTPGADGLTDAQTGDPVPAFSLAEGQIGNVFLHDETALP